MTGCRVGRCINVMKTTYRFPSRSSYPHTSPEAIRSSMRCLAVSATLPNIDEIAEFLDTSEACEYIECEHLDSIPRVWT